MHFKLINSFPVHKGIYYYIASLANLFDFVCLKPKDVVCIMNIHEAMLELEIQMWLCQFVHAKNKKLRYMA